MAWSPSFHFQEDGTLDHDDYYRQIEDHAEDNIKLINQLLLDEKHQPFMYQALLHKYKIENDSYNQVWVELMSKGYASIDQVIAPCNLKLSIRDLNWVMYHAAKGGHKGIIEMMIARGAPNFDVAMAYAAYGGHKEIVELMIDRGANDMSSADFNWAMGEAAMIGHREIVELLINHEATN